MKFASADKQGISPLKNSIRIELNALAYEVGKAVVNPVNVFSSCCGVNNVEHQINDSGKCTKYTIYYESKDRGKDIVARSKMVWYNQRWASLDNDPHPMCFKQSLLLITIEQKERKSVLNCNIHYDIENDEMLQMFITGLN